MICASSSCPGMLGDTGRNHPDNWVGGLARSDPHAIVILFARDAAERSRCQAEHTKLVARSQDVEVLSTLDLEATPPFDYAHDHFGYRDRLSQPVMQGTGEVPTLGSGPPLQAGEFIIGYPDEDGPPTNLPRPEILSRNGSYMAYRRLEEHVGKFRDFLREHGETPEEQELNAAKLALLVFGAPCQLPSLVGQEHGRTIPLAAVGRHECGS